MVDEEVEVPVEDWTVELAAAEVTGADEEVTVRKVLVEEALEVLVVFTVEEVVVLELLFCPHWLNKRQLRVSKALVMTETPRFSTTSRLDGPTEAAEAAAAPVTAAVATVVTWTEGARAAV